jgi:hypothetical protein
MRKQVTKTQWYNIYSEELNKNKWILDLLLMQSESAYNEKCFSIKKDLEKQFIIIG